MAAADPFRPNDSETLSVVERELKFELPAGAVVPDLSGAGPVVSQAKAGRELLDATYFDTEGNRLAGAGITLRRRSGGADAGWHLKLPTSGGHREELRASVGAATATVPSALADRVRDVAGELPLVPVARIETSRSTFELRDRRRKLLAVAADDQVVGELPRHGVLLRWRELEIELTQDADEAVLTSLAGALRRAGIAASPWPSKLRRLLAEGGAAAR